MTEKHHTVAAGECVLSLAAANGVPWKKIWDHPGNQSLVERRRVPGILAPGDVVVIPDVEPGGHSGATEQRHRFRRLGKKVELRIRIHDFQGPRANEPYHLEIGDRKISGETSKTDAEGLAVCRVPASANEALLIVGKNEDVYQLLIGHMDPIDSVSGLHARLENMGYDVGGVHSPFDDQSATAMSEFLFDAGVEVAGQTVSDPADRDNQQALQREYGV